jgi:ribose transport system ATP-binding protein
MNQRSTPSLQPSSDPKPAGALLVQMEGIEKSFPGVHALSQAQFDLRAGEVHALVGENGAGKSTLMKVLAGVYHRDAGRILVNGQEVEIPSPRAALDLGISMIHQELNLMPHLTVAQNIFIGREPRTGARFWLDERQLNRQAERLFESMRLNLDPTVKVANLTVAKQQMVEIAKAFSYNAEVLIMDEPTAALTDSEIEELFRIIRQFRDRGVGAVYISHRLEELPSIADRITVMRDGQYISTGQMAETSKDQIISMMVGRTIYESSPEAPEHPNSEIALEVRNLNRGNAIRDVSFMLRRGEILGFAGLIGAGRTEVARAIFGADPIDSGEVLVGGQPVKIRQPKNAVAHGIGYLSEDRKRYGLALKMDVESNVVLAAFRKFVGLGGWVNDARTRTIAQQYVEKLAIKTPSLAQKVKNLSGGNQQKVLVSRWLLTLPDVLMIDEPTRGIDVGAKSEIHRLMSGLAKEGKAILMVSSEMPEILGMSDRVLVMAGGRITAEFSREEVTQEKVLEAATIAAPAA